MAEMLGYTVEEMIGSLLSAQILKAAQRVEHHVYAQSSRDESCHATDEV